MDERQKSRLIMMAVSVFFLGIAGYGYWWYQEHKTENQVEEEVPVASAPISRPKPADTTTAANGGDTTVKPASAVTPTGDDTTTATTKPAVDVTGGETTVTPATKTAAADTTPAVTTATKPAATTPVTTATATTAASTKPPVVAQLPPTAPVAPVWSAKTAPVTPVTAVPVTAKTPAATVAKTPAAATTPPPVATAPVTPAAATTAAPPVQAAPTAAAVTAPATTAPTVATTTPAPAATKEQYASTPMDDAKQAAGLNKGRPLPTQPVAHFLPWPTTKAYAMAKGQGDAEKLLALVPPPPPAEKASPNKPQKIKEKLLPPPPPGADSGAGGALAGLPIDQLPVPPSRPTIGDKVKVLGVFDDKAIIAFPKSMTSKNKWPRTITLGTGEQFESLTIVSINRDGITIEEDGERSTKPIAGVK